MKRFITAALAAIFFLGCTEAGLLEDRGSEQALSDRTTPVEVAGKKAAKAPTISFIVYPGGATDFIGYRTAMLGLGYDLGEEADFFRQLDERIGAVAEDAGINGRLKVGEVLGNVAPQFSSSYIQVVAYSGRGQIEDRVVFGVAGQMTAGGFDPFAQPSTSVVGKNFFSVLDGTTSFVGEDAIDPFLAIVGLRSERELDKVIRDAVRPAVRDGGIGGKIDLSSSGCSAFVNFVFADQAYCFVAIESSKDGLIGFANFQGDPQTFLTMPPVVSLFPQ